MMVMCTDLSRRAARWRWRRPICGAVVTAQCLFMQMRAACRVCLCRYVSLCRPPGADLRVPTVSPLSPGQIYLRAGGLAGLVARGLVLERPSKHGDCRRGRHV
ncbi:Uncharacterised protein [Actinobaculum suis]|uniref:Uncharacterized protein n=1 Tax=Actinobaculum suis TaxID=1657 RepID=A0A7Z8Y7L9_9ACTO|nr:Uncharacterised protein [Actinobaculum suis]